MAVIIEAVRPGVVRRRIVLSIPANDIDTNSSAKSTTKRVSTPFVAQPKKTADAIRRKLASLRAQRYLPV